MAVPNPDSVQSIESLPQYEAVRLFVDRALAIRSDFVLTNANVQAVAQICHRLDGIPLAIELAAVRVSHFAPEEIAARIEDRFRLLTGGLRTSLPRHQTLHALIDWSYALLTERERTLFRRLSVFAAGWTFDPCPHPRPQRHRCLQSFVPGALLETLQSRLGLLGEAYEVIEVAVTNRLSLSGFDQLLLGVLTQRLEQSIASMRALLLDNHKGLVD